MTPDQERWNTTPAFGQITSRGVVVAVRRAEWRASLSWWRRLWEAIKEGR